MPLFLLLWAFGAAGTPQSTAEQASALLSGVRKQVMKTLERLPKYLCTETVDRVVLEPDNNLKSRTCEDLAVRKKDGDIKLHKHTSDRLRLDLAIASDHEMYSWAGENHFDDRSLQDLVRGGATSSGAFSSLLASVFGGNGANFTYTGSFQVNGRPLAAFNYQVPIDKSRHTFGNGAHRSIVPYHGAFWVDPDSFDLVRMSFSSDQLPPELEVCESNTTIDYANIRLRDSSFLIPKDNHWRVINLDGSEYQNRTQFAACREFLGESTLKFDAPEDSSQTEFQKTVLALPPNLPFTLTLAESIHTATAAAGDVVKAKFKTPITLKHHQAAVLAGTVATGRIMRLEWLYGSNSQSLTLTLKLESLELNGVSQPFNARLMTAPPQRLQRPNTFTGRQSLRAPSDMAERKDPSLGVLHFENAPADYVIAPGLEIKGKTAKP